MTSKKLTVDCAHCGATFTDYPSNRRKFCSQKCSWEGTRRSISIAHGGDGVPRTKSEKDRRAYAMSVDERKAARRKFYKDNRDRILLNLKTKDRTLKAEIIAAYGGACTCCGEVHHEFLTIDHTNGDGAQHRKLKGKGRGIYLDLKARGFPQDGYRLMCLNCNIALGFYGYCPHNPDVKRVVLKVPPNPGRKPVVKKLEL